MRTHRLCHTSANAELQKKTRCSLHHLKGTAPARRCELRHAVPAHDLAGPGWNGLDRAEALPARPPLRAVSRSGLKIVAKKEGASLELPDPLAILPILENCTLEAFYKAESSGSSMRIEQGS